MAAAIDAGRLQDDINSGAVEIEGSLEEFYLSQYVIKCSPGDVLLFVMDDKSRLSDSAYVHLSQQFEAVFPDVKCVVVEGGLERVFVVSKNDGRPTAETEQDT